MLWEIWSGKRAYSDDRMEETPLDEFIAGIEKGEIRPNRGKFAAEVHAKEELKRRAIAWGDVARKCWSAVADERPSTEYVFQAIGAIK